MRRTTIFHSAKYDLVSYGNGSAYMLHDYNNKRTLYLQGEDAIEFQSEIESWENNFPDMPYDRIMAELCVEYSAVMEYQVEQGFNGEVWGIGPAL